MITSVDGTTIGCRTTGRGPGVLVIPGPMEGAGDFRELAEALANDFTVHVLDRRGRGESGPHRAGHGLRTEVEDVRAVLDATGAQRLLGVSSGAVIALEAALRLPGITHVVAYEPPIDLAKHRGGVLARFEQEVEAGRHPEAVVTITKGLGFGPLWLRVMLRLAPRWVLVRAVRKMVAEEGKDLLEGLPTVRHDLRIVEEGSANLTRFGALRGHVLLIGGTRSPSYLTGGLYALADLLPHAEKILVDRAHHFSAAESPRLLVPALEGFLGA
ncbi:pimeloyl-ACP methyl ester carboxylesterase [Lentzea atacamensis]|uniref:Pimeloyl-ACP methyl ester carboxylesterase n=1 Tax=Lentzea atacamensis TaxID=531938 RepID=A0ABX9DZZ9_9PSEU|nr:alpha/beta fold hydrolase [Lentzea atacamensis]RAS61602.1 pimeloyl-ACP methyl ester carboxylesterase [Lentzea atacamensis]